MLFHLIPFSWHKNAQLGQNIIVCAVIQSLINLYNRFLKMLNFKTQRFRSFCILIYAQLWGTTRNLSLINTINSKNGIINTNISVFGKKRNLILSISLGFFREIWDHDRRFGFVRISHEKFMWWVIVSHNSHDFILRPFVQYLKRKFSDSLRLVDKLLCSFEFYRQMSRQQMKLVWPLHSPCVDPFSHRRRCTSLKWKMTSISSVFSSRKLFYCG